VKTIVSSAFSWDPWRSEKETLAFERRAI